MALYELGDLQILDVVQKLIGVMAGIDHAVKAQTDPLERIQLQANLFTVYGDLAYCVGLLGGASDSKEVANAIAVRFKPEGNLPEHQGDDAVGPTPTAGGSSRTQ